MVGTCLMFRESKVASFQLVNPLLINFCSLLLLVKNFFSWLAFIKKMRLVICHNVAMDIVGTIQSGKIFHSSQTSSLDT